MLKLNLKIALRNLWKNTGYTIINVGGLAIGLASCMILLLYVAFEWGYDKQFKNFENSDVVYNNQQANGKVFSFMATPGVMAETIRAKVPGVKWVTRTDYLEQSLLTYKTNSFKKSSIYADPDFLKIFDYKVLKGNPATFLKNPNSVILTESFAATLFGKEDPINKTVTLDNSTELKVDGLIADVP
jgi:putative ABC transport system permease protein